MIAVALVVLWVLVFGMAMEIDSLRRRVQRLER